MKLTHDEFLEYIKKNGVTDARTTEDWKGIPKGTLIKFDSYLGYYVESRLGNQYIYEFDVKFSNYWSEETINLLYEILCQK